MSRVSISFRHITALAAMSVTLNAGTFGPNSTDGTFGPEVIFSMTPPPGQSNLSPYAGLQFFGEVNIDRQSKAMTVDLKDINGDVVFSKTLCRGHSRLGSL